MSAPPTERQSVRVYYFDHLRVWATIGVVLLHSAGRIVGTSRAGEVDFFSHFNVANAYDSLGRFGVNCFFMVSGALLLAPTHRFRLRKQILRVFWPLLTWSVVYAVANLYFNRHELPTIAGASDDDSRLTSAFTAFFTGPLAFHLWFVYALLGIYLVIPLLRPLMALPDGLRSRLLHYAFALWFVFSIGLPTVHAIWPDLPTPYALMVPDFPSLYLGVFLLGFYCHHRQWDIPRSLLVGGVVASVAVTALLVYLEETLRAGSLWAYDYYAPNVIVCVLCLFLLAKSAFNEPGSGYPFVRLASKLSYRIYLMHILILHYLGQISPLKDWYAAAPAVSIPALAAATLVLSFALSWLLEQVRPINAYV